MRPVKKWHNPYINCNAQHKTAFAVQGKVPYSTVKNSQMYNLAKRKKFHKDWSKVGDAHRCVTN